MWLKCGKYYVFVTFLGFPSDPEKTTFLDVFWEPFGVHFGLMLAPGGSPRLPMAPQRAL